LIARHNQVAPEADNDENYRAPIAQQEDVLNEPMVDEVAPDGEDKSFD
jgi:hypothetical protein